ncbi:MAG: DEAD/DEAH box helicase family protein [Anaerolineae bacterium]
MPYSESDTRAKLIDPAIHTRGWTEDLICREESARRVEVIDGKPRRRARGRVDYTLRVKVNPNTQPVALALIEAKAENLPPAHGLEQGKAYAECKRLNVSFVFSSNGHLFVEYDRFTGQTSAPRPLTEFPTPAELRARYEAGMGFSLAGKDARPLLVPYPLGESSRRYYQDAAIRAVMEKLARGEKRALLSLATGAGKTRIAVNLLKRIDAANQLRKALFICDREELRSQAAGAFQNLFGANAAVVTGNNPQKNARVLIATYQTLDVDSEEATANFLKDNYPVNYFSHIVIDECHRSAWGKWSEILARNPDAVQIGLTATPRQLVMTEKTREAEADAKISADNLRHFGEPVYEYDMSQGIEDGYLAACEIQKSEVDLDHTGITLEDILARHPINADTGEPITRDELQDLYAKTDYEDRILLPDRVLAMTRDLFQHLLATGGPEQKTIIFCVRDRHADDVAIALNNLYNAWCAAHGREISDHYAFKCTAASSGNDYLADLRGATRSHFVATTVDLLSTGVDVPCVRNIVFFKYVKSPISFYQMVGRGTRIDEATNKLMFRIYDYTDATRLFGEEFHTKFVRRPLHISHEPPVDPPPPLPPPPSPIQVEGFEVHVTDAGQFLLTMVDGKALPVTVQEYKERLTAQLLADAPTLDAFRASWIDPDQRQALIMHLPDGGQSASLVRALDEMTDYDLYDVLAKLAYGLNPRTRLERVEAFNYKHAAWLYGLPPQTAQTLRALVAQFGRAGTEGLENRLIFRTPEVIQAGGLPALQAIGNPFDVLRDAKQRIFAV